MSFSKSIDKCLKGVRTNPEGVAGESCPDLTSLAEASEEPEVFLEREGLGGTAGRFGFLSDDDRLDGREGFGEFAGCVLVGFSILSD